MAAEQDWVSEAWVFGATTLALLLAMPWMHHRLKAYQHAHATYGDRWFGFTPVTRRFYAVYARGSRWWSRPSRWDSWPSSRS